MQVIPLEKLGRPRIDVVVNCSGVFRDLFVNQMILLDRAVKMAAEQDEPLEMNFVRKHAIEQVASLTCQCYVHLGQRSDHKFRLFFSLQQNSTSQLCMPLLAVDSVVHLVRS